MPCRAMAHLEQVAGVLASKVHCLPSGGDVLVGKHISYVHE